MATPAAASTPSVKFAAGVGGGEAAGRPSMARQKSSGTLRTLLGAKLPGATSARGTSWSSKLRKMGSDKLREMYKVMGGASGKEGEAAAAEFDDLGKSGKDGDKASPLAAGLRELLAPLKLDGKVRVLGSAKVAQSKVELAVEWCDQNGVADMEDLHDMDDSEKASFVKSLALKVVQLKKLCRALKVDEGLIELLALEAQGIGKR